MFEELYGQDILLDEHGQAAVAVNGEALVSGGIQTVLQEIKLRFFTPYGALFYDVEFGSKLYLFVNDENTPANRRAACVEVLRCLNLEPRVVPESASCRVLTWDEKSLTLSTTFRLIDETHPFNLVVQIDSDMEMVIKDVNTTG